MDHPDLSQPAASCAYLGEPWELGRIFAKNLLLGLCTLQVYWLWGQEYQRRYIWPHIEVAGEPLTWTGSFESQRQAQSFLGRVVMAGWLLSIFAQLVHVMQHSAQQTVAMMAGNMALGLLLRPLMQFYSYRYQLSHTRLGGVLFGLDGDAMSYARVWYAGALVAAATLGLGYGYFAVTTRQYLVNNSRFGGIKGQYTGNTAAANTLYALGGVASVLSLGAYLPWHIAKVRAYHADNMLMGAWRLRVTQEGSGLSNLWLSNALIYLGTLGLGGGVARNRSLRYQMEHVSILGFTGLGQPQPSHTEVQPSTPQDGLVDAACLGSYGLLGA